MGLHHLKSLAVVLCNCLPSVTQKQHLKALSNGLGAAAPAWSTGQLHSLLGVGAGVPCRADTEHFVGPGPGA